MIYLSENILMGLLGKVGTGAFDLILDERMLEEIEVLVDDTFDSFLRNVVCKHNKHQSWIRFRSALDEKF